MKRLTALLLTLVLALSLAACGGGSSPGNTDGSNATTGNGGNAEKKDITFSEVVVVDNDACLIKIKGIDPDNIWGYTLNAELENKSADKTYMFAVDRASVNKVETTPAFAKEVAPGKKANEGISLLSDELKENGVVDFTDIALTFRVYDTNDWTADPVAKETVHIYPYGEDKAETFVRQPQDSDKVILDNEYVTAIVTGYENDEIWGYSAKLFLLNKSSKNIMFSADDVSVNGYMADPFFATSVSAGNCSFASMSWSDTTLEENNITDIEEIEFKIRAYDNDDWMADDLAKETVTLNP